MRRFVRVRIVSVLPGKVCGMSIATGVTSWRGAGVYASASEIGGNMSAAGRTREDVE